jgi:UDP-hydrolysing UDP-N-acetyl-D-glucosamine 2-epimerase
MNVPARRIAVVTVARSDYGIYLPILRALAADRSFELQIIVGPAHFQPKFGETWRQIEGDGFVISERLSQPILEDTPQATAVAMGRATADFANAFVRQRPDIALVLGDRFEMHAAVVAALPLRIPVAHIHGGELTFGAIDDALRHSITKLSHLHFPATEGSAARIRQMGEEPWRIRVSGAPGLDNLVGLKLEALPEFAARHSLPFTTAPLLVTYHPVTLEHDRTESQIAEFFAALASFDQPILFTLPNADAGHESIIRAIKAFVSSRSNAFAVANLGTRDYFSAMSWAAAMVGNSSSGIIEAASFKLPVVNVGNRQAGRDRAANVLDCADDRASITATIRRALDPAFRASLENLRNPYGDGHATERIVETLKNVELGDRLLVKRFADLPVTS